MSRRSLACAVLVVAFTLPAAAWPPMEESPFPEQRRIKVQGVDAELARTGIAVRYRTVFKVYVVASYLQEGMKVKDAKELVACDAVKQLRLRFLMGVSSAEMTDSFLRSLRANHPVPAFDEEVKRLLALFEKSAMKKGDEVVLTHLPKVGLCCKRPGGEELVIRNVDFSRAVWDNYFGKNPCSEDVKKALLSELP